MGAYHSYKATIPVEVGLVLGAINPSWIKDPIRVYTLLEVILRTSLS